MGDATSTKWHTTNTLVSALQHRQSVAGSGCCLLSFGFETSLLALSKKISEGRASYISTTLSIPISCDKGQCWQLRANLISHYHSWDNNQCHTTTAICIIQKQRAFFIAFLQTLGGVFGKTLSGLQEEYAFVPHTLTETHHETCN